MGFLAHAPGPTFLLNVANENYLEIVLKQHLVLAMLNEGEERNAKNNPRK